MSKDFAHFLEGAAFVGAGFLIGGPAGGFLGSTLQGIAKPILLSTGLSLASSSLSHVDSHYSGLEAQVTDPLAALPIIYGTARVGAKIVDLRVTSATSIDLYVVAAFAHGGSQATGVGGWGAIYFNGTMAVNASGTVQWPWSGHLDLHTHLGADGEAMDTWLASLFPSAWPTTARGSGVAYAVFKLTWNDVWAAGFPQITADITGPALYDPRDSAYHFPPAAGVNPWVAVYDYLTSTRYGCGFDPALLDVAGFVDAANYADTVVTNYSGGADQPLLALGGALDTNDTLSANLAHLLAAARGDLVWQGGIIRPLCRRAQAASSVTLAERNILGPLTIRVPGLDDVPNRLQYEYVNGPTSAPMTRQWPRPGDANTYLTADNGYVNQQAITLLLVNDSYRAEQIAAVTLRERRSALSVRCTADETALQLQVGDVVAVTHTTPAWSGKLFWVLELHPDPMSASVGLLLVEYDGNAYATNPGAQFPAVPNTSLPDPLTLAAPTGLTVSATDSDALLAPDGTFEARLIATWTASTSPYVHHYRIQSRMNDGAWVESPTVQAADAMRCVVGPVVEGESYDVQVAAVNALGVQSAWAVANDYVPSLTVQRVSSAYVEDFSTVFPGRRWVRHDGVGTAWNVPVIDAAYGGSALRLTGPSGWRGVDPIPIDPARLYAVLFRVRQRVDPSSGGKDFYLGVRPTDFIGQPVNSYGENSEGSLLYVAANALTLTAGPDWRTYVAYLRGYGSGGHISLTTSMLSQSGLGVFSAANLLDGDDGTVGFSTDAATAGAALTIDLGVPRYVTRIAVNMSAPAGTAEWAYQYSDDGTTWLNAINAFVPTLDGWYPAAWPSYFGAHRYWRLRLNNTPGAGPEVMGLDVVATDPATGTMFGPTSPNNPAPFPGGAVAFMPLLYGNWPDGTDGIFECDVIVVSAPAGSSPDQFAEEARRRGDQVYDGSGRLLDTTGIIDASATKALLRGLQQLTGLRDGTLATFPVAFQFPPAVGDWQGGLVTQPTAAAWSSGAVPTGPVARVCRALDVTASTFTPFLKLVGGGPATNQTDTFTGSIAGEGDTITCSLSPGGANNSQYVIRWSSAITWDHKAAPYSPSADASYGIFSDDGSGSVLRKTVTHSSSIGPGAPDTVDTRAFAETIAVSALGSGDTIIVELLDFAITPTIPFPPTIGGTGTDVQYTTATDNVASMTPTGVTMDATVVGMQ